MSLLQRFVLSTIATCAFALCFGGAAALVGRGMAGPLAVVELADAPSDTIDYGLVDIDRGLLARKTVAAPGFAGARFDAAPPLVLQADHHDGVVDWTLSELDPLAGTLAARVAVTTQPAARLNFLNFVEGEDESWRIYSFNTGETYYVQPGRLEAQIVTVPGPDIYSQGLVWSPDGTRAAIPGDGEIIVTDARGENGQAIPIGATAAGRLRWSPDGRYVASSWGGQASIVPSVIVDTISGEVAARVDAMHVSWCGDRALYTTGSGDGIYEARLLDPQTGAETVVITRDLSQYPRAQRTFSVSPLDRPACAWFLVTAIGEGYSAYHLPTHTRIDLGINVQLQGMTLAAGAMTLRVNVQSTTELRRVVLDPPAAAYDTLATVRALSTTLTWLDEARGSLNLSGDVLYRIDPSGAETALTPPGVLAFYVIED